MAKHMGFFEDAAVDALSVLNEVGKDITVKIVPGGTPVALKAMITQPMVLQDMETGGFLNQTTFEVKVLRSTNTTVPGLFAYGNIVTYNGEEYRIVAVADRPPAAWIIARVQTKVQ
jgi:hypothetical protein